MAIAFRSAVSITPGAVTNPNPGEPTGTANGDILIGMIMTQGDGTTPTLPTGWTQLYTGTSTNGTTSSGFKFKVGYIVRGGSAAATTFGASSSYGEVTIMAFSGGNTSSPIDSQSAAGTFVTTATAPNPPSTTAVGSACMAVAGGVSWNGSQTGGFTASTGYTVRSRNTGGEDLFLETKLLAASGAADPAAIGNDNTGTGDRWHGFTITLAPAGAASALPASCQAMMFF